MRRCTGAMSGENGRRRRHIIRRPAGARHVPGALLTGGNCAIFLAQGMVVSGLMIMIYRCCYSTIVL
jgi:hypothetical protein